MGPKTHFEKPFRLFVSPTDPKAVVVWLDEFQGKKARIQSCDLRRGKVEETGDFAGGQVPLAASADLSRVVASEITARERDVLFLYDVDGPKLKPHCLDAVRG